MKIEDLKELKKENLERLIVFASRGIKKKINNLIELNEYDVTFEEYLAVVCILENKGIYQSELAIHIDKDRHATSRVVDSLIKKDLIYKELDAFDSRKFKIYPTDICRKKIIPKEFDQKLFDLVLGGIDNEDLDKFKEVLINIIGNLLNEYSNEE